MMDTHKIFGLQKFRFEKVPNFQKIVYHFFTRQKKEKAQKTAFFKNLPRFGDQKYWVFLTKITSVTIWVRHVSLLYFNEEYVKANDTC